MNRVFQKGDPLEVPDGTIVYPFLNAHDAFSTDVPWDLLPGFSLAFGRLNPGNVSKVVIHPVITQVTLVMSGSLKVRMKSTDAPEPYVRDVSAEEAVVTRPLTFLQLENPTSAPTLVLYAVTPPYVFDLEDGIVRYDDARVLEASWDALRERGWPDDVLPSHNETTAAREQAERRIARRRGVA